MGLLSSSNSYLLALAPHTVSLVAQHLAAAGIQRTVDLFLPVFPVDLGCSEREKQAGPGSVPCAAVPAGRAVLEPPPGAEHTSVPAGQP